MRGIWSDHVTEQTCITVFCYCGNLSYTTCIRCIKLCFPRNFAELNLIWSFSDTFPFVCHSFMAHLLGYRYKNNVWCLLRNVGDPHIPKCVQRGLSWGIIENSAGFWPPLSFVFHPIHPQRVVSDITLGCIQEYCVQSTVQVTWDMSRWVSLFQSTLFPCFCCKLTTGGPHTPFY